MSLEGIDEWDENFLEEAFRVELEATSSLKAHTQLPPPLATLSDTKTFRSKESSCSFSLQSKRDADSLLSSRGRAAEAFSFSPPRELSQRISTVRGESIRNLEDSEPVGYAPDHYSSACDNQKYEDVEMLKKDLYRLSEQLDNTEKDCVQLKKDCSKKDELLKSAFSQIEAKDAEIDKLNKSLTSAHATYDAKRRYEKSGKEQSEEMLVDYNFSKENGTHREELSELRHRTFPKSGLFSTMVYLAQEREPQSNSSKTVGVQTELVEDSLPVVSKAKHFSRSNALCQKLDSIWFSSKEDPLGKCFTSKLFSKCSADMIVLFGGINESSKRNRYSTTDSRLIDKVSHESIQSTVSIKDEKMSDIRSILIKMAEDPAQLPALLRSLLDICSLENGAILCSALRMLHAILQQFFRTNFKSNKRDSILGGQLTNTSNSECVQQVNEICFIKEAGMPDRENKVPSLLLGMKDKYQNSTSIMFLHSEVMFEIFEVMRQISSKDKDEKILVEALSIMVLILRSNSSLKKENFMLLPILESMSELLQKGIGIFVQMQAVQIMFLLLQSPKILTMFCGHQRNVSEQSAESCGDQVDASVLIKVISCFLQRLSECLAFSGSGFQEIRHKKRIIVLLAFLASSGNSGFEVILLPTHQGLCFLELIIRVLLSEVDVELVGIDASQEVRKERTLLMREALIFLNRLVSHSAYSKPTLDVLTSVAATRNMIFDVLSRISRRDSTSNSPITQLESEVVEFALLLKSKLTAFLERARIL